MVDQFTLKELAIRGKPRLNCSDVAEALNMAVRKGGRPKSTTVDNGNELSWKVLDTGQKTRPCTWPSFGQRSWGGRLCRELLRQILARVPERGEIPVRGSSQGQYGRIALRLQLPEAPQSLE